MNSGTVGTRLKTLREAAGLTLDEAGRIGETTKQSVSQIEKGITKVPGGLPLYLWSRHYGVNLEWLITGKGDQHAESHAGRPDFTKIAGTVYVLTEYLAITGGPPDWVSDRVLLEIAYAIVDEFGEAITPSNVVVLAKRLGQRLRAEGVKGETGAIEGVGAANGKAHRRTAGGKR